uniref:Uncharacterized protein n=1 Tax=Schistosoma japonicum TaxID=6182 RepID=Q5BXJ6_SCHJA|nr:unknown [Schistosoma japonicum]
MKMSRGFLPIYLRSISLFQDTIISLLLISFLMVFQIISFPISARVFQATVTNHNQVKRRNPNRDKLCSPKYPVN